MGRCRREGGPAVWVAGSGIFISAFDLGAVSIGLKALQTGWHLGPGAVALLGSASLLGMLAGGLGAGFLADVLGRRSVLLLDLLTFVLAAAASALAPNPAVFAVARLLVGVGIGADYAVAFPYLAETQGVGRRGQVMAAVMWAANFGVLAAYGLGAAMAAWAGPIGWRYTLLAGALLALPALAARRWLPESAPWRASRLPWRQALGTLAAWREQRLVAWLGTAQMAYQVTDQGLTLFLPLMLMQWAHGSVVVGSLGSLAVKAVTIPAALVTVWAIERVGRLRLQATGFALRAGALAALAVLVGCYPHPGLAWAGGLLAVAYFFGALGPDKTTVIVPAEQFPTPIRASGQGMVEAVGRLGGILGVVGWGVATTWFGTGGGLWWFAAASAAGWAITRHMAGRLALRSAAA